MAKKNRFLIFLIGNVFYGIAQWFIILILVKQHLLLELGYYTYGVALIGPIFLFFSFGLNTLIVTKSDFHRVDYLNHRLAASVLMLFLYVIIILFFTNIEKSYITLLISVALIKITEGMIEVNFSYNIKEERHDIIGFFKISMSLLLIGLTIFFTFFFDNLYIGFFIYSIIVFSVFVFLNRDIDTIFLNITNVKTISILGIPISITLLISSLNTNIPRYLLENYGTIELVGVFSSLLIIYSAGNTLFFSIYNFVLPKFVKNKNNKNYVRKLFIRILLAGIIALFCSQFIYNLISKDLIRLLYTTEFLKYDLHLNIVIISSIFVYMGILMDVFINGYEKFKFNTIIQIINLISILIVGLVLIPEHLILGAVLSFLTFALTNFFLKLVLTLLTIRRNFNAQ